MTPTEKLKQKLIHSMTGKVVSAADEVQQQYLSLLDEDGFSDAECELRNSGVDTGLPCDYSRHYESKAVAAEMLDGSWVGWTYWYGGGKHGQPSEMPWLEDAYEVEMKIEMQPVKVFSRK